MPAGLNPAGSSVRGSWRRRPRGSRGLPVQAFVNVELSRLDNPQEQKRLLSGILEHGMVILTLPPASRLPKLVASCYRESAAFFGREMYEKAPYAVSDECPHGCAIYEVSPTKEKGNRQSYMEHRKMEWPFAWSGVGARGMAIRDMCMCMCGYLPYFCLSQDGTEFFEVKQYVDERLWSWPSARLNPYGNPSCRTRMT